MVEISQTFVHFWLWGCREQKIKLIDSNYSHNWWMLWAKVRKQNTFEKHEHLSCVNDKEKHKRKVPALSQESESGVNSKNVKMTSKVVECWKCPCCLEKLNAQIMSRAMEYPKKSAAFFTGVYSKNRQAWTLVNTCRE